MYCVHRTKWHKPGHKLSVGDIILIKDETLKFRGWPIAKVTGSIPEMTCKFEPWMCFAMAQLILDPSSYSSPSLSPNTDTSAPSIPPENDSALAMQQQPDRLPDSHTPAAPKQRDLPSTSTSATSPITKQQAPPSALKPQPSKTQPHWQCHPGRIEFYIMFTHIISAVFFCFSRWSLLVSHIIHHYITIWGISSLLLAAHCNCQR